MRRRHSFLVSGNLSFLCLSLIVFLAGCGGGSVGTPKPIATSLALPSATATTVPIPSPTETATVTGPSPVITPLNFDAGTTASAAFVPQPTIAGLSFVPVTPCRIADTRNPAGPFGGPFLHGQAAARAFAIPSSACGIPNTAQAYALNMTVVPRGPLGFLTAFPCGQPQPLASNLNSIDGRVKAVAAILPAGTNGAACFFASNDTDLVLDINGYFVPDTDPTAMSFYPMAPCRLVDTRLAAGPLGGPSLVGNANQKLSAADEFLQYPSDGASVFTELHCSAEGASWLSYHLACRTNATAGFNLERDYRRGHGKRGNRACGHERRHLCICDTGFRSGHRRERIFCSAGCGRIVAA